MQLYVLTIVHEGGQNTHVFSTLEKAQLKAEAWAIEWWTHELGTEIPAELVGEDLVEEYFERMSDTESYKIDQLTLDAE